MEVTAEMRSALMKGRMTALPPDKSNIVRIFMSSTFADMAKERNILLQKAYPELREFCQKQGLDFQVMDMRWGVRDEVVADHMTCALCLMEIDTCKRLSVGPNFVAFLGNRYGYRPIPAKIEAEELDILIKKASELDMDTTVIKEWYLKDDNAVPAVCLLQPITSKFKYYTDMEPANESLRQKDKEGWYQVTAQLENILRTAVKAAHKEGLVTEEQQHKYIKSVTETEINRGIIQSTDANQRAVIFIRNLQNIEKHVGADAVSAYLDLMDREKLNEESQRLLEDLKGKLPSKLKNVHQYEVEWTDKGVNEDVESHASYLERFSDDFVADLKAMIFKSLQSESEQEQNDDWFLTEVISHARFCQAKCESFCGRQEIFDAVYSYMKDTAKVNHQPFVIHGASGSGKSSIMAMLAQNAAQTFGENLVTIIRFLGTSPHSTLIHPVLQSLCLQICEVYGIESPVERVLNNFAEIVQYLSTLLDKVSEKDRPLLILLDSLDQLSSVDRAYSLTWLPKSLPPNVHIVVSTLPEEFDLLKTLKRTIRSDSSYIQVPTLSEQVGSEILDTWLARIQRCLTEKQREVILSAFSHCRQPLFLKLAFDEARRWKSYTPESELRIAQSARAAINLLYERLEVQHGTIFVSHTMGYIAAARNGIAEHELEDVLSLDDEVLDDVYQYWSPPNKDLVRIPPLIVTRLKYDIMEYLAERQADGKRVLQLFHRQFIECAQERYLAGDSSRARHHILADFFLGTWSNGRRKEITMDVNGKKEYYNADRNVVPQPMKYDDNVFNRRKLNEVTFHLLHAGRMDDIFEHTLGNLNFMHNMIDAFSVKDLIEDYNMVLQVQDNLEIRLLRDALRLIKPTLEFKGGYTNPLAAEFVGRLDWLSDQSRHIESFMSQCRAWCTQWCVRDGEPRLIPQGAIGCSGQLANQSSPQRSCCTRWCDSERDLSVITRGASFPPPGGPLRTTLAHHRAGITSIAMTPDGGYMVTAARDCTIRIYENESDVMELERTLTGHTAAIEVLSAAPNNELLVSGSLDNTLKVWNLETGRLVITMEEDHAYYQQHALLTTTMDSRKVVSPAGKLVNVWDIESGKLQFTLKGHEGAVSCLAVSHNNQYIITGAEDNTIKMWSTETGELKNTFSHHTDHLTCLRVTQDERIVSGSKDTTLSVIDMEKGEVVHRLEGHSHPIYSLTITSDGRYAVSGSDKVVKLWNLSEGKEVHHLQGHYGIVDCVGVTSDNKVIVSGARDEHLNVWDFQSGQLIQTLDGQAAKITAMEVTGYIVVTASTDSYYTKVWDVEQSKMKMSTPRFIDKYGIVGVTSDAGYVVYKREGSENEVNLWNSKDGKDIRTITDKDGSITCLRITHNNNCVVTGDEAGFIKLWNLNTGQFIRQLDQASGGIRCFWITRMDRYLVAVTDSNAVSAWDIDSMTLLWTRKPNCEGKITCVTMTDDRKYTAVGTDEKQILVFDNKLDKAAHILVGHQSPLTCLSVSHNQKLLASGSSGETMRVWDLGTGRLVHELYAKSPVFKGIVCLSFSHDDKYLLTGGHDRSLKMWDLETGNMVTAQYVYATITNIVANRDNIVLTTKLGYVIIEDILLPSPRTPEPDESLLGGQPDFEEAAQPVIKVRSRMMKKSHFCQIL
ncbi:NACHT domain- and WD repeat-containing protein 1-like isoform X1 [Branchiostoma floridae]|uniref:NACHT domain- and WD repeat-containing protein 1-like isoform X1 n=1 Tax=Branchiostoma floridae TaxID=7739 RepID=A0A9J7L4V0_BRAFL|nr:NACHT domain- and WD repeat-containing protein 1-like isoform X1 [Branchiostoma floridae]XP_035676374.1 NACHT domain- and WD repeat-containing protein 1-like isoform X1 [Branchiostoma floridae]XP_035676375.1 NACHT domain- and WD repeat-containing protein 1-like isoform X1 [Branchiostoma floridae]XP_035676377.1 NACHT domain- and WD repeat-containing protein 1-like isoform X1 [Branchiostoma floridae]